MKKLFVAIIITIVMGGCSTLQVQVDHDPEYDFSSLSTFAVVYTKKDNEKDFTRARISKLLNAYMQNKGYRDVYKSDADFYITVHLDIQKRSEIETNYETMGIRPVPYMYLGLSKSLDEYFYLNASSTLALEPDVRTTTRTYEYEEEKILLEVFDVKQNRVVWQGITKDELPLESTPEQKNAYLSEVIEKIFGDFPSHK
ncbi:MAG: DUF4136 domain-containing protein [Sulfurimonas sp.]|nr:DUF4136 domain-containing protein [Sulfurimonas sp.]